MTFTRFLGGGGGGSGFSRFSSGDSSNGTQNDDPYSTDKLDKQITNAQTRIEDAGYKPQDADNRNWFEKATNLPQGQNFLFDALELISRPGKAVENAIHKGVHGENSLTGAWRGFSGQDRVSGADLAQDMGIDNKVGKFLVGTALDIGLDPTTYIPGGVIAKGLAKSAEAGKSALKAGTNALETAAPALRTLRETKIQPALERGKDSLGYMFNPDYKITETLNGGESTAMKDLAQQTDNSRGLMRENALKRVGEAARGAGGINTGVDVGRVMEAPLQQLDEAGNLIPRTARDMPSDPKIQQAAKSLMDGNNEIRQFAEENGIPISEMEGYMTHVWSKAERDMRKNGKIVKVDQGQFNTGNPNKKVLAKRELMGSAEDVNDQVGRTMFEPNAYFASAIGQQRLIDYTHAVNFRRQVLSNKDFAVPLDEYKATNDLVPKNAEIIDSNNYTFMKDSGDVLDGVVPADKVGGRYVVTKQAKQLLDRYQHLNTDEGTKAFIKAFDATQSVWKRLSLFSPGYHVRNVAGAMFNNHVGGMNPADLVKYTSQAAGEVTRAVRGKSSPLFEEYRKQGLGASSLNQVEFARYGQEPETAIQKTVKNLSKTTGGKVREKLNPLNAFKTSQDIGTAADQVNRFALFKWGVEKKGMTPEQAAAKVREVQFDYSKTTPFERNVVTRVVPFYRWMRNNIPFQIRQFINDPRKYNNLNKIRLNAQDAVGITDENVPDYMKESFAVPLSGDKGKGKMLGLNLPLADLTKLSSPLKTVVDSLTPLIKTPIELATNHNMFYGKPIEKFAGEKKQFVGGGELPVKTAYALEQATGQIGRGLSGMLQKTGQQDQDTQFRLPSFGIKSLVKDFDADKAAQMKKLQQLRQMQDLILYIEQQTGQKPRTLAEIQKAAKQLGVG